MSPEFGRTPREITARLLRNLEGPPSVAQVAGTEGISRVPTGGRPREIAYIRLAEFARIHNNASAFIEDPRWIRLQKGARLDTCERWERMASVIQGPGELVRQGLEWFGLPADASRTVGKLVDFGSKLVLPQQMGAAEVTAHLVRAGHASACSRGTQCPCARSLAKAGASKVLGLAAETQAPILKKFT